MGEVIPPFPNTPSWSGAELKVERQIYLYVHNKYSATDIVSVIKSMGNVGMHERGETNKSLVGKSRRKSPCERSGPKWEDNIKTDLKKMV
jgi:hypothetical protein